MLLEKALRYLVIAGIFALPFVCLIVSTSLFFPYITGKNFTFRIIVEVITGAWLALALVNPKYRPRRSWILAAFCVFVFVIALADAFGVNAFKSFWSNYERMDGWITIAHILAYLVVTTCVMTTEKLWRWLWQLSLAVSVWVSIKGLMQLVGISALGEGGVSGLSARIDASFGNPIYMAVYMLFHIFIAAHLWTQMWQERGKGKRMWYSILYGSVIVLDTITLSFTGTRGTIVGLIGGALLSALLLVIFSSDGRGARRFSIGIVIAIIVVGGGFWAVRDSSWVHRIGFLERLATISATDSTVKARFLNWQMAWRGVQERPVLGWGQENYAIVFDKYYDPRMYGQEPWFDRVHNIFFDWLVAGGFLGLLSYLSIFVATLWVLWKSKAFTLAERSIFTGLLAGYFCHNFFVFDNITSYILFGTVLAYLVWRAGEAEHSPVALELPHVQQSALPVVAVVALVVVAGGVWFINAQPIYQNLALLNAISPQQEGINKNLELFKTAVSYGTFGTQEVREQLVQGASQVASGSNVPTDIKQKFFDLASHEMTLQEAASPLDARFPLFLGVLEDAFGDYADAGASLEKAHELSPQKQSILFELAQNQLVRGDTAGALKSYEMAYTELPDDAEARLYYAAALIRVGNDTLADQVLAPVIDSGVAADPRIAAAYAARKRYDKIVTIWQAAVKANPKDPQGYFTLAAGYFASGNSAAAIETLRSVEVAVPTDKVKADAESLIQQVQNGTAKVGQ